MLSGQDSLFRVQLQAQAGDGCVSLTPSLQQLYVRLGFDIDLTVLFAARLSCNQLLIGDQLTAAPKKLLRIIHSECLHSVS